MSVRIEHIELPGIGTRDDIVTKKGSHVGVITYRDGGRGIVLYEPTDPDTALASADLNSAEADALAELLGQTTIVGHIAELGHHELGLFTEQLALPPDSRFINQTLREAKAHKSTGVSIVAILRENDEVVLSPTLEETLLHGDILVAVGTRSGLDALEKLMQKNAL